MMTETCVSMLCMSVRKDDHVADEEHAFLLSLADALVHERGGYLLTCTDLIRRLLIVSDLVTHKLANTGTETAPL